MSDAFDIHGNKRQNLQCCQCEKKRFLSNEEAEEDGWVMMIDNRDLQDRKFKNGLTCPSCKPSGCGIPRNIFQCSPSIVIPRLGGGFTAEYHW